MQDSLSSWVKSRGSELPGIRRWVSTSHFQKRLNFVTRTSLSAHFVNPASCLWPCSTYEVENRSYVLLIYLASYSPAEGARCGRCPAPQSKKVSPPPSFWFSVHWNSFYPSTQDGWRASVSLCWCRCLDILLQKVHDRWLDIWFASHDIFLYFVCLWDYSTILGIMF